MKVIKKLKRKLNNQGSSIVMVIVALAFIGIIVGSLLTAAGAAYTLKRQELNAKDNFYYVEQAMQEIYTGVGMQTIEEMKSAYSYTIENMVRFDTDLGTYRTISDDEANIMFKQEFMNRVMKSDYFKRGASDLAIVLQSYVTDPNILVDQSKLSIIRNKDSIILKDVTVTRNHTYGTNASGDYTQTISADIVISEPDFTVSFNTIDTDYSAIFEYAMVADMGVEIRRGPDKSGLSIAGNIYAASDYYNKSYHKSISKTPGSDDEDFEETGSTGIKYDATVTDEDGNKKYNVVSGNYAYSENGETKYKTFEYEFSNTTSKKANDLLNGYVNDLTLNPKYTQGSELPIKAPYDGENDHSRYSGLYIDGTNVSIQANTIIIPGSLAVMNQSDLAIYGRGDSDVTPQVWVDDIVLGGNSAKDNSSADNKTNGASAVFRADLFVKDDTQLDANGSSLTISGSYYGFGDGTSKDTREFIDTVEDSKVTVKDEEISYKTVFQYVDAEGDVYNRGHFNSSSIAINGQNASLDFSHAKNMYIAGRAFVEFSRYGTEKAKNVQTDVDASATVKSTTYTYTPMVEGKSDFIRDYKTGESIAYKTSQIMYNVSSWKVAPESETRGYDAVVIPEKLNVNTIGLYVDGKDKNPKNIDCFAAFFPKEIFNGEMPVTKTVIKDKEYVFIDFDKAWEVLEEQSKSTDATKKSVATNTIDKFKSVDDYKKEYAYDYSLWSNPNYYSTDKPAAELIQIAEYSDFEYGEVNYGTPTVDDARYSSGVITVNAGNTFSMTAMDDVDQLKKLFDDAQYLPTGSEKDITLDNKVIKAINYSDSLEDEYNFMKWNLTHFKDGDLEEKFIKDVIEEYGEACITPINKYIHMNKITEDNQVKGKIVNDGNLEYKIWACQDDITIDDEGDITGIIICKGDVTFGSDVKSFTGLIISGGKIFVGMNMTSITAAPATCREILRQCMRKSDDDDCLFFINLFNGYEMEPDTSEEEPSIPGEDDPQIKPMTNVNTIGFSDIVSMENWTRTVGGAYGVTE